MAVVTGELPGIFLFLHLCRRRRLTVVDSSHHHLLQALTKTTSKQVKSLFWKASTGTCTPLLVAPLLWMTSTAIVSINDRTT